MKKLKSTLPNMAIVLTLIAVIAGGALAYVNSITKDPIAAINQKNLEDGIRKVLGDDNVAIPEPETMDDGTMVYRTEKGVAVQSQDPQNASFGGDLTILVGFDNEGNIMGYTVLKTNETPGLGAKAGEWFQEGQKGNIIGKNPATPLAVTKDGGDVDAITASTITSRSFLRAVNAAYVAVFGGDADALTSASQQANPEVDACEDVTTEGPDFEGEAAAMEQELEETNNSENV